MLALYNVAFVLPLLAITAVLLFAGEHADRWLTASGDWLQRRWPVVLAGLLLLVGAPRRVRRRGPAQAVTGDVSPPTASAVTPGRLAPRSWQPSCSPRSPDLSDDCCARGANVWSTSDPAFGAGDGQASETPFRVHRAVRVRAGPKVTLGKDFDPSFKAAVKKKKEDPQGVAVHSFKVPSPEELDHEFLWRYAQRLPAREQIGIFNRSHYEDVLVVRVHPELLDRQQLPSESKKGDIWRRRYRKINGWERYPTDNGVRIAKVFLNLSKEEQRTRFLRRIDLPDHNWKFSSADVAERARWGDYHDAFSEVLSNTSTDWAP